MIKSVLKRGLWYTIGIVINRVVPESLFRFRVFRVFELANQSGQRRSDGDSLTFRWCENDEDYETARRLTFFETTDPEAARRFSACLAAAQDPHGVEEIVGGVWRGQQQFDEEDLGIRIMLDDHQAWIFAAYVSKNHRGSGIYRRLLAHAMNSSEELVHHASINPFNKPSIAAHRSFVKKTVGTCIALRLFNFAIVVTRKGLKSDRSFTSNAKQNPIRIQF